MSAGPGSTGPESEVPEPRTILRHAEQLAVVRLPVGADLPAWVSSATLMSITVTANETSVVCTAQAVPRKARPEGPFAAFEVAGLLAFSETGVIADLLAPLASAGLDVFVVSTHDTTWLLVRVDAADAASESWTAAGHAVEAAPAATPPRSTP